MCGDLRFSFFINLTCRLTNPSILILYQTGVSLVWIFISDLISRQKVFLLSKNLSVLRTGDWIAAVCAVILGNYKEIPRITYILRFLYLYYPNCGIAKIGTGLQSKVNSSVNYCNKKKKKKGEIYKQQRDSFTPNESGFLGEQNVT